MASLSLLWFRRDLRLTDQAAVRAAVGEGPVLPVYVLDDETPRHRHMGSASRWWLHHSLASLDASLRARGSRLILRRGNSAEVLAQLAAETGASRVHALHHYEPWWRNGERELARTLDLVLHNGNFLLPPGALTTGNGQPYRIYTPFMRALWQHMPPPAPRPAPEVLPAPACWPESEMLAQWRLTPHSPDWAAAFRQEWTPGEDGAHARIRAFTPCADAYDVNRDLPSAEGSSRLSPHLHFGEVSPATVWHGIGEAEAAATFLRELIWRDYAQNIILAFPDYGRRNAKAEFDAMPWRTGSGGQADLAAWKEGRTGYPIVDAGMRQLWATGWMHNRVRMIAASFLVKHLLIDWRAGEQWFWDTLVDADYANNAVNWQWVAGTGVDASMFGRIMAPLVQSEKFEAGNYIRRWVPELAAIGDPQIHDPDAYGLRPAGYPPKRIGHRQARERALAAYARIRA